MAECGYPRRKATLTGGLNISTLIWGLADPSHTIQSISRGTVGCIANINNDTSRDHFSFITCNHVLTHPQGQTTSGDVFNINIVPVAEGAPYPENDKIKVGEILNIGHIGNHNFNSQQFYIDCASVKIATNFSSCCNYNSGTKFAEEIIDLNLNNSNKISKVTAVTENDLFLKDANNNITGHTIYTVYKVGQKTGRTKGRLFCVSNPGTVFNLENGDTHQAMNRVFQNPNGVIAENIMVIVPEEVNCLGNREFSAVGDSGAAIVNERNELIGILVAESPNPVHLVKRVNGTIVDEITERIAFAAHISPVLDRLQVTPITHIVNVPGLGNTRHAAVEQSVSQSMKSKEPEDPLEKLKSMLSKTEMGRAILKLVNKHTSEFEKLFNKNRSVKIVWQRSQGPAFTAHFLNSLQDQSYKIPKEVKGITLKKLLTQMDDVINQQGSEVLKDDVNKYAAEIIQCADKADSIQAFFNTFNNSIAV